MLPFKWPVPTVPLTWEQRLEVGHAMRALAAQEKEWLRQRQADIAALRRDSELLRRDCSQIVKAIYQTCRGQLSTELRAEPRRYHPDQPRVPAGNPDGGQWTSEGESGSPTDSLDGSKPGGMSRPIQYVALDTGTRTDATADESGSQIAAGAPEPNSPIDLQE